jgi:hypothetical protein
MRHAGATNYNQAWLGLLPAKDAPLSIRDQGGPVSRRGARMRGEGIWDVWSARIVADWTAKQRKAALKHEWLSLTSDEARERWIGSLQDLAGVRLPTAKLVVHRPRYYHCTQHMQL